MPSVLQTHRSYTSAREQQKVRNFCNKYPIYIYLLLVGGENASYCAGGGGFGKKKPRQTCNATTGRHVRAHFLGFLRHTHTYIHLICNIFSFSRSYPKPRQNWDEEKWYLRLHAVIEHNTALDVWCLMGYTILGSNWEGIDLEPYPPFAERFFMSFTWDGVKIEDLPSFGRSLERGRGGRRGPEFGKYFTTSNKTKSETILQRGRFIIEKAFAPFRFPFCLGCRRTEGANIPNRTFFYAGIISLSFSFNPCCGCTGEDAHNGEGSPLPGVMDFPVSSH